MVESYSVRTNEDEGVLGRRRLFNGSDVLIDDAGMLFADAHGVDGLSLRLIGFGFSYGGNMLQ